MGIQHRRFYAAELMKRWRADRLPAKVQRILYGVLSELHETALLTLIGNEKVFVVMKPKVRPLNLSIWAYLPVYPRRLAVRLNGIRLSEKHRVLLLFSIGRIAHEKPSFLRELFRDHVGHVLLYLKTPSAPNHCEDAEKEWRRATSP